MQTFNTPGVFVQEIQTLPASVAPVATAIPAFIGYTEKATNNGGISDNLTLIPTRISSLAEYVEIFGGAQKETDLTVNVNDTTDGAGNLVSRAVSVSLGATASHHNMFYALSMYFANGGGPCWIVSVGGFKAVGDNVFNDDLTDGLAEIAKIDEPTILVVPEAINAGAAQYLSSMNGALMQAADLQDRFAIIDVADTGSPNADASAFRGINLTIDNLRYGAAYYPNVTTTLNYAFDEADVDVVVTVDAGPAAGAVALNDAGLDGTIKSAALAALSNFNVQMAPSSLMAGVYARVDRDRGVWKAPANVGLANVLGPSFEITAEEQGGLNVDPGSGKSINAIRSFTGKGTLVWGARTLAGNDNEWRYVSVRRLFNFIEESIRKATESVVFEANDANTWLRTKTQIESFLNFQFSAGALAGSTPEQAYFVNVGLGVTMTPQDILEGRMIVEVGLAAVRPAEFIILRFSQKLQEA